MSYQNKYAANKLKFDFYEGANYYNCLTLTAIIFDEQLQVKKIFMSLILANKDRFNGHALNISKKHIQIIDAKVKNVLANDR